MERKFIEAYKYYYGGTIKAASRAFKAYSEEDPDFIIELIKGYLDQCKLAFYND